MPSPFREKMKKREHNGRCPGGGGGGGGIDRVVTASPYGPAVDDDVQAVANRAATSASTPSATGWLWGVWGQKVLSEREPQGALMVPLAPLHQQRAQVQWRQS